MHTYKNILLSSRGIAQSASQCGDWAAVLSANFAQAALADWKESQASDEQATSTMLWAALFHRLATPLCQLTFAQHCRRSALLLMVWGVNADVVRCLNQWASQPSPAADYLSAALAWLATLQGAERVDNWPLLAHRQTIEAEWAEIWRRLCERWQEQDAAPLDFLAFTLPTKT